MSHDLGALGSLLTPVGDDAAAAPYRVLARKYRPSRFEDLIGQDAMVRTLTNAFSLGRIHQAYLLTGVRGVGKTTTARILARALNYHRVASGDLAAIDAPSMVMEGLGSHCQAIIDSRHVDVVEMDAASHTGIDDIREIIEGARYRPVMARHKVYIIDEVHMLSKAAFNGLLKTLEEPPGHVKFLFATTEADKVPVTVRSRCQRFDLRRVEGPLLAAHLATICAAEGVAVDEEALALIARAAEGSVRDALSLLDQAIAHGGGAAGAPEVAADTVRGMLGLADRGRVIDLFEAVAAGDVATALTGLRDLYDAGADPLGLIAAMADFVHLVTRLKLVPDAAKDATVTAEERRRGLALAAKLGVPVLTRAWQMLAKGLEEVRVAPRPLAAADMVLVRLAYAADLPTPGEAIRRLTGASPPSLPPPSLPPAAPSPPAAPTPPAAPAPPRMGFRQPGSGAVAVAPAPTVQAAPARPLPRTLDDVVALAAEHRDIQLKTALERDVRLVRLVPGTLEFEAAEGASSALASTLSRRLTEWTGIRWVVALAAGGAPTLRERAGVEADLRRSALATDPLVAKVLALFPGSRIVDSKVVPLPEVEPEEDPPPPADDPGPLPFAPLEDEVGFGRDEPGPDDSGPDDL